jgi:hypothetical protein
VVAQVVKHLPKMCKTLGSIPNIIHKNPHFFIEMQHNTERAYITNVQLDELSHLCNQHPDQENVPTIPLAPLVPQ